jgi:type II secretory pathway component PulF
LIVVESPSESVQVAESRLEDVLRHHQEIASVLSQTTAGFAGKRRRQFTALSKLFRDGVAPQRVLENPDALAICVPLLHPAASAPLARWQIQDAVLREADNSLHRYPGRRRWWASLVYPLAILVLCGLIMIGICLYLVPEFDRMFSEFGLRLPPTTTLLIWISRLFQRWGIAILVASLVAVVVGACLAYHLHRSSTGRAGSRGLSGWFISTRGIWALWAWHVGLLLDAGLSLGDAIAMAGRVSGRSRLQQASQVMIERLTSDAPRSADVALYFPGGPLPMLAYTLQLQDLTQQSAILRDVAVMYWDQECNKRVWWLSWLSPAVVCVVGLMVGVVVVALFGPLVQLIRGLT